MVRSVEVLFEQELAVLPGSLLLHCSHRGIPIATSKLHSSKKKGSKVSVARSVSRSGGETNIYPLDMIKVEIEASNEIDRKMCVVNL